MGNLKGVLVKVLKSLVLKVIKWGIVLFKKNTIILLSVLGVSIVVLLISYQIANKKGKEELLKKVKELYESNVWIKTYKLLKKVVTKKVKKESIGELKEESEECKNLLISELITTIIVSVILYIISKYIG